MPRDTADLLEDIRAAAERARRHVQGMDPLQFQRDEKTVDAVVRCLTILGEAAKQVPAEDRERHPQLPWREMAGLRDRVVHDYLGLDLAIVWRVVDEFLPALLSELPGAKET